MPRNQPPPPNNNSDLLNELVISARWSALSYCPSISLKYWKCGSLCSDKYYKLELINHYQEIISGSSVLIGHHNSTNTIIISYRGSRNIQNWVNNINLNLAKVNGWEGEVHFGFYNIYKGLRQKILDSLESLIQSVEFNKDTKLLILGHSLGGALASYLNLDIINLVETKFSSLSIPIGLNTFGSPRVGNGKFSDYYYQRVFNYNSKRGLKMKLNRVVNNNDIVPHLPYISNGFVHIPHQLWYKPVENDSKSKNLTQCEDLPYTKAIGKSSSFKEDPNCSSKQILWNWQDHLTFNNITFGMPCI